ncbi:MAG: nicotinate-nucleotide--dimethylbenzimidazole phosphoribosyltransferase [Planctomycetota bacterium]
MRKIKRIDYSLAEKTQRRLDNLTKPQGSLGRLEELAKQIVEITGNDAPPVKNKVIFTMAGDHGRIRSYLLWRATTVLQEKESVPFLRR